MALPPAPAPVSVVLPLEGDPLALLEAVVELSARWPEHVDAQLVVPTPPLSARDRAVLAGLGEDVAVVEVDAPGYGHLVAAAVGDGNGLVLDPARLPDADALLALAEGRPAPRGAHVSASALVAAPVLTAACDLAGLQALLTVLEPLPEESAEEDSAVLDRPLPDVVGPGLEGLLSVVVPVGNHLAHTKVCLESLRRTTRRPYEIVVVDDGSRDGTAAWLAGQRDLVVLTNPEPRGRAAASNQGILASRGEHVVVVDDDAVLPRFWAEAVLRAFAVDPRVGAVGLRSSSTPGLQRAADVGYRTLSEFRSSSDAWRRRHAGQTTAVTRLTGRCLAVRRAALLQSGALDEGYGETGLEADDLSRRLLRDGWTLHVADEVLVHHHRPSPRPALPALREAYDRYRAHGRPSDDDVLVSAALIVKDEQRALPECLAALRGVVDEIVVCDTGSTDRTVEVAEAFGADVVHEPWRADFAAARNTVLEHCRGRWVLSVDADEQLGVEPDADLRLTVLALEADAATVRVRSRAEEDGAATFEHQASRLFRRGSIRWVGAVHEAPVDTRTGSSPVFVPAPGIWLDHDGYVERVHTERGKTTRNLELAEKDHALAVASNDSRRTWKTAFELARTLMIDSNDDDRVEALLREALASMPSGVPHLKADVLVRLAAVQAERGRLDEAEQAVRDALAVAPGLPGAVFLLARVLTHQGRHGEALSLLDAPRDDDGGPGPRDLVVEDVQLPLLRGFLLYRLDRTEEAAAALLAVGAEHPAAVDWPLLHATLRGRSDCYPLLAKTAAGDPQAALAALDGLAREERQALHAALADLGIDAAAHSPAAVRDAQLDRALVGHDAVAVAQAALALEDEDLGSALDLWRRLPAEPHVLVARARCLLQLGQVDDAVDAVEGLDLDALEPADLLVVAAVAGAAGDRATAQALLDLLQEVPADLQEQVDGLTGALGLAV